MIRGISLPYRPKMSGITIEKILGNLDLLHEFSGSVTFESSISDSNRMERHQYYCGDYITTVYETDYSRGYDALWFLLDILQEALPDFLVCHRYSSTQILYTIPNYYKTCGEKIGLVYDLTVDELMRLTVFLIKSFTLDRRKEIVMLIRDYVDLCIVFEENNNENN